MHTLVLVVVIGGIIIFLGLVIDALVGYIQGWRCWKGRFEFKRRAWKEAWFLRLAERERARRERKGLSDDYDPFLIGRKDACR